MLIVYKSKALHFCYQKLDKKQGAGLSLKMFDIKYFRNAAYCRGNQHCLIVYASTNPGTILAKIIFGALPCFPLTLRS